VLTVLLLGVDFLDELTSGIPFVGSPDVQRTFGLSYAMAAGWTLAAIQLLSLLLEPPLFVLADRYPKKRFVCGGLLALGLICILAGLAPSYWVFLLALALLGPASGCGVTLSQAVLMDANPENRERMMTRWTFMGCAGDLATPALLSLLGLFALGWRHGFVLCGLVVVLYAGLLSRQRFPDSQPERRGAGSVSVRNAFASAIRNRRLLLWSAGVWLCCLLDEIVIAFGALYVRDHLGAGLHVRGAILMLWMAGQLVGLVVVDRLLARVEPLRLLMRFGVCGAVAYVGWVFAPSIWLSGVSMAVAGLFCSALYPIAQAQAYRVLPDHSGTVNAVVHLFLPLTVALPVVLGFVADAFGLTAVLLLLAVQPIGLFWIAAREQGRAARSA
jgi:FSR family fosmidomycin resistance protein-like MFS transporter